MSNFIKLENIFVFLVTMIVYLMFGFSIWMFLLFLLVPDIFMVGYMINKEIGSKVYNVGHTYIVPILFVLLYLIFNEGLLLQIALVWLAHISMDRSFGFGLKYASDFNETTIQKI
ncbi:DUF4260 domain-containing protein [Staphylococcus shinii]|uniref:DUF4260 domain-containing protein n=1 Tax=Staphylococcus shinii TaxID=2912228 RepID=UPI00298ED137|nr:DUF4260 domain-containing protein [Staphylococcus shinii]MDW8570038.1 DUF4260 domain-containing protein [Staphylococcus shinii]MDW8574057.1 DUF4260 domain-containing protein [Staphylococcus shinii]